MKREMGAILLITGLVIIGIAPYMGSMKTDRHEVEKPEYIIIDPSHWKYLDNNSGITLFLMVSDLPVGPKKMMEYRIDYPLFTQDNVAAIVKENNFISKNLPVKISDSMYAISTDGATLSILPSTTLTYLPFNISFNPWDIVTQYPTTNSSVVFSERFIDINEAESIAMDFIDNHGGLPDDGRLIDASPTKVRDPSRNLTINRSYGFAFHRFIDDKYEVIGQGERINIVITNVGNLYWYTKTWVSQYQQENDELNIHDSFEALNSISAVPLLGSQNHTISSIDLCYYHPDPFGQTQKIRPVWAFYLDYGTNALIVDAETLEQYYG